MPKVHLFERVENRVRTVLRRRSDVRPEVEANATSWMEVALNVLSRNLGRLSVERVQVQSSSK